MHCYHNGVDDSQDSLLAHGLPTVFSRDLGTIFLDRDGVLNEKPPEGNYITCWADFHLLPGVPAALRRLNQAGLRVVVVTNQRGIALGLYSPSDVEAIQSSLQQVLKMHGAHVDAFYFCPHDERQCSCRKPLPGLFEQAVAQFPEITAATSVMIGDSLSDIEFGRRLGMLTVFIQGDPEFQKPTAEAGSQLAEVRSSCLAEAVDVLLAHLQPANQPG